MEIDLDEGLGFAPPFSCALESPHNEFVYHLASLIARSINGIFTL